LAAEHSQEISVQQPVCLPLGLQSFHGMERWTSANLSTAWDRIIKIIERFTDLAKIGNINADVCRVALFERILRTADLTQLFLGFIVSA
jgi:hypothetical protein